MAKILVLGAGISGHVAAAHLRRKLSKEHQVVVVSPNSNYQWIPSNIWVGIGRMKSKEILFPLAPLYKRKNIDFLQAKAMAFYPEGDISENKPYVLVEYVTEQNKGKQEKVTYDYLINATGPKLNFEATEGLIPEKNKTHSVCTYTHAEPTWKALEILIHEMKQGKNVKILKGTGHPKATCQGAAFEYILNVERELVKRGVRDKAEITWISNEYKLGDFGIDGALLSYGGMTMKSNEMMEMIFEDRNIKWILGAGVTKIEDGIAHYENLDGEYKNETFDFAMLIPAFSGHGFKAYDKNNQDITDKLFKGFMIVDADYTPKPYEEWRAEDWPSTYQSAKYENIYAAGIAFAPPHGMSKPMESPNGTKIFPTPPRTGMPSGVIGKIVAQNIIHIIKTGKKEHLHKASMARMGAACIVSAGYGIFNGQAAVMTVNPIVSDWEKYPEWGRNINDTVGIVGTAGHWIKLFMHYLFLYKAKAKPFWYLIPE